MTITPPHQRPTSWWLAMLRKRAARMGDETLDLSTPITFDSPEERAAAVAFFNAAYRAEESGLAQAHALAAEVAAWDPDLAECLRLYGDEEGWHRSLLLQFLEYLGGEVRPMGRITGTFYGLYGRAERMDTIVLTNLMFETIGSTTYRLALRRATHPAVRQMLTILTRDESFHVPLNVHFLRQVLAHDPSSSFVTRLRLRALYHSLYVTLIASAAASRRRALKFDRIPFGELARAYAEHLGRLFLQESDLALSPSRLVLRACGLHADQLAASESHSAVSVQAAEAAVDRERVQVTAL
ncbi:MAG: ferritin-like domain-containing protein [Polyangiales bacterium]